MLGAGIGSFFGGAYADYVGRQGAMLRVNAVAVLVYAACACCQGWVAFMIARALAGRGRFLRLPSLALRTSLDVLSD